MIPVIRADVMESPLPPYVAKKLPATITASVPDASAEPCTLVPLYENSTRTGYEFEFLKRATRELPRLSYETVTPPVPLCPATTATCNNNMETETKKMYRPVLERIVMAHFNNELIAYVNTGIDPGWGKGSVGQLSVRVVGVWETPPAHRSPRPFLLLGGETDAPAPVRAMGVGKGRGGG
jgi:hypothetical protein